MPRLLAAAACVFRLHALEEPHDDALSLLQHRATWWGLPLAHDGHAPQPGHVEPQNKDQVRQAEAGAHVKQQLAAEPLYNDSLPATFAAAVASFVPAEPEPRRHASTASGATAAPRSRSSTRVGAEPEPQQHSLAAAEPQQYPVPILVSLATAGVEVHAGANASFNGSNATEAHGLYQWYQGWLRRTEARGLFNGTRGSLHRHLPASLYHLPSKMFHLAAHALASSIQVCTRLARFRSPFSAGHKAHGVHSFKSEAHAAAHESAGAAGSLAHSSTPVCFLTEPIEAGRLAVGSSTGGAIKEFDGVWTAEACLRRCLDEPDCMAVAFEHVSNLCHGLPKEYDLNYRVLLEDMHAGVADKTCSQACSFSRPMRGKSPGSTLNNYTTSTLKACQDHCEEDDQCLSLVFRAERSSCLTLPRLFDGNLEYSTDDALLSNKACKSKCTFLPPQLASSALRGSEATPGHAASWKACADECVADSECRSVVYQEELGACHRLTQSYDAKLFLSTADAKAANKVCDASAAPQAGLQQDLSAAAAVDEGLGPISGR